MFDVLMGWMVRLARARDELVPALHVGHEGASDDEVVTRLWQDAHELCHRKACNCSRFQLSIK